ncbi:uncharacterized protein LOC131667606 [Phymastichus coffea]|uniref:uncharacterized protein LOC131667606 n=1 Tax=Phymastichus coffea TaxID=108790 RepID=UPI00273BFCFC|nr:uncharacterized protein LOC131667606 [Phymastichus coffea]
MWESELIQRDRQLALLLLDAENNVASRFPKFVNLVAFLERRAQSLLVISADKEDKKTPQPANSNSGPRKVYHAQASGSGRNKPTTCSICSGEHLITHCPTFLAKNVHDRLSDVRRLRLCYNCLSTQNLKDCKSKHSCKTCNRRHHSLIHFNKRNNNGNDDTKVQANVAQNRVQTSVIGVGGCKAGTVKSATCFTLQSQVDVNFKLEVNAFVLPRLTSALPSRSLVQFNLHQFKRLRLADPQFHISDRVDLMIGADLYGQLLLSGVKNFTNTLVVAQNTALGCVVSGPTHGSTPRRAVPANQVTVKALRCEVNDDLSEIIQRFWTVEEVPVITNKLKPADEECERFFTDTHARDRDGHFRVRLPLIGEPPIVAAETRRMALGSLKHQHRRISNDPELASAYVEFMQAYEDLGHMERVLRAEINNARAWYLPHHIVVTGTPLRKKYRVVFDASRKTLAKNCLNDFLMVGPPLQRDLVLILLNWRRFRYGFTADIVKMFRQIRVAREDQDFQRIIWSPSPQQAPIEYRLTTVTYGTACAPYLAIRTLLQLARDEKSRYPLGAECLEANTYVDDTFSGADDLPTAIRKRDELVQILKTAGVELDKWAANYVDLLPPRDRSNDSGVIKEIDTSSDVKTLGVHWKPSSDEFSFSAPSLKHGSTKLTKRALYSEIARLFDPLGWLSPVTVVAKIIMQDLWIEKCDWDEPVSVEIYNRWQNYRQSLAALPTLSVNRWLGLAQNASFKIHGFSDASSRAYAAVVYIRITFSNGQSRSELVGARTKVASVKTISIPNLELCGATLLVKYVRYLQKLDFLKTASVRLWSDSQIVLTWHKKHPCHWKTFVANRVSLIRTELPSATWAHVPTKQNPADLATRGATPTELKSADLWWHGPTWLVSEPQNWPQQPRAVQALHTQRGLTKIEPVLLSRYFSLRRLLRITAWMLRPILQRRRSNAGQGFYAKLRLCVEELDNARAVLIKLTQAHAYAGEITLLRAHKPLPKHNSLCKLTPFLDYDGILRVGGRLSNANLPCHVQHPPILPRDSAISRLYVRDAHERALHGGPTLTTSILLRFAWIIGMRPLVKSAIHKCVPCQRHKPRLAHQLMGNLPAERVTPNRPFTITGLDYGGPIRVRISKGRGQHAYKGYIVVFICFATKAIHLELVSDLTTKSFIAPFRRFASRRGLCKLLFSDNATTFKGADAELRAMFQEASTFYKDIAKVLADDGTSWTFIPPTTPHYGGLWEAGVKSTKNLLKKTIGEHTLTFEELTTVLVEIEACLNSRPLCPLTTDPEDLQALTPSHFLLGAASGVVPDQPTPAVPENRLGRFQLLQRKRKVANASSQLRRGTASTDQGRPLSSCKMASWSRN